MYLLHEALDYYIRCGVLARIELYTLVQLAITCLQASLWLAIIAKDICDIGPKVVNACHNAYYFGGSDTHNVY